MSGTSIPVTLFTGFLGSGKSTLVNRLLRELPRRRFGLVVNEFGDAALESQLIEARTRPLFELPAGCLCCVSDGDLEGALRRIREKDPKVDHILVEASGLSSPGPLVSLLTADREASDFPFHLGAVFCIVDASSYLQRDAEWPVLRRQLQFADAVLLTKTDLCDEQQIAEVTGKLAVRRPGLRVFASGKAVPWNVLFEGREHSPEAATSAGATEADASVASLGRRFFQSSALHGAQVFEYASTQPLSGKAFGALMSALEPGILRAKGIVYLDDRSAARFKYVVQYTGAQKQLYSRRWDKGESRASNLVFLGTSFDADALKEQLDCCQV
ncbi:MAG: GTP-binding protein [Spirochaetales bacterium]